MLEDYEFEEPKFNPWDVKSLEDFHFYCCPECPSKTADKTDFIKHAVIAHPHSQSIIERLEDNKAVVETEVERRKPSQQSCATQTGHHEHDTIKVPDKIKSVDCKIPPLKRAVVSVPKLSDAMIRKYTKAVKIRIVDTQKENRIQNHNEVPIPLAENEKFDSVEYSLENHLTHASQLESVQSYTNDRVIGKFEFIEPKVEIDEGWVPNVFDQCSTESTMQSQTHEATGSEPNPIQFNSDQASFMQVFVVEEPHHLRKMSNVKEKSDKMPLVKESSSMTPLTPSGTLSVTSSVTPTPTDKGLDLDEADFKCNFCEYYGGNLKTMLVHAKKYHKQFWNEMKKWTDVAHSTKMKPHTHKPPSVIKSMKERRKEMVLVSNYKHHCNFCKGLDFQTEEDFITHFTNAHGLKRCCYAKNKFGELGDEKLRNHIIKLHSERIKVKIHSYPNSSSSFSQESTQQAAKPKSKPTAKAKAPAPAPKDTVVMKIAVPTHTELQNRYEAAEFKCYICRIPFVSLQWLQNHQLKEHRIRCQNV